MADAPRPHFFTQTGAKRIVDAVRRVEGSGTPPFTLSPNSRPGEPNQPRWLAKITGEEAGGGKYTANIYLSSPNLNNPARDVQSADIEGTLVFSGVVVINLQENEAGTHDLADSSNEDQIYFPVLSWGKTPEATPRLTFIITGNGIWIDTCTTARPGAIATRTITDDATLDGTDETITVGTTAGDITITLPDCATIGEIRYSINNTSSNDVLLQPSGSDTIDGFGSFSMLPATRLIIYSDGTAWYIVSGD